MATNTTKKAPTKKPTRKTETAAESAKTVKSAEEPKVEVKAESKVKETVSAKPAKRSFKDVDMGQYITVKNGFHGTLVYKSSRTGETFIWDSFGDEQDMELIELKNAKNSNKAFFINNWFMFDDENAWVIDFLGLNKFYENSIGLDGLEEVFTMPPEKVHEIVSKMSDGQKRSLAYRAKELASRNAIDSISVLQVLEEDLGISLIEK